ncbi:MAG: hypothetical protein IJD70_03085 [Clostridia bacterium]|nr:hypothetical protein [Clostridia bacterium]
MSTVSGGRRRAFRSRHHTPMPPGGKLAVIFVSIALVLFVLAVMLGNYLRTLAEDIIYDTTEPVTTEAEVYYANPPANVIAQGIIFGVDYSPETEDATEDIPETTFEDTTEVNEETQEETGDVTSDSSDTTENIEIPEDPIRFDSVSVTLREKDRDSGEMLLAYNSSASLEYSIDRVGSTDLDSGVDLIYSNWGERTKICGIFEIDYLNRPDETRSIMRAYEIALICELVDAGFDEILLLGFTGNTDEGLSFISDVYEQKGRGTVIGLGLSFEFINATGAKEKIDEIAKKCGFLALDLYSVEVPSLMNAQSLIADRVLRAQSICSEYSIRMLLGCGSDPDCELQTRAAMNSGADNIMTGLGVPEFPLNNE